MASVFGGLFKPMRLRERVARWIAPKAKGGTRMYAGARQSRLTGGFGSFGNTSADAELSMSLTQLRSRSRQLVRDAPYAKRAKVIVVNNVIGTGVGLQAQVKNTRDELFARINDDIEEEFKEWSCADSCHTGGALHFSDLERAVMSEVFTAGEAFVRMHPRAFGDSDIPFALELIEAERLGDDSMSPAPVTPDVYVKMGVELDSFDRAVAYWIRERHPGDLRQPNGYPQTRFIRVPAEEILHIRLVDRWPQTRGEPWLHPVLRKLNDMEEYSGSELVAARMASNYFGTIHSPEAEPMAGEKQADGSKQLNIEPGMIDQLSPGDEFVFHAPNRPNPALDPFMRYMLREVAAGTGVSYESLSRDYSQSNYSSSRLALLDDRDLWRVLQAWWARSFRDRVHARWLQAAVYSGAVSTVPMAQYMLDPSRFEAVRWKFRGWSWVDPTKEVEAYREAVRCGFTTTSAVIAQTAGGLDIEDVLEERAEELKDMAALNLVFDTDPTIPAKSPVAKSDQPAAPPDENTTPPDGTAKPARVVDISRSKANA